MPRGLLEAGRDILRQLVEDGGFCKPGVFGSVAHGEDEHDSDPDVVVDPAPGASLVDLTALQETFSCLRGSHVDLVIYSGLDPEVDRNILRDTESMCWRRVLSKRCFTFNGGSTSCPASSRIANGPRSVVC
jgi:hypothetical protein